MSDERYDVAISFLQADEPLAIKLQSALSPNLNVFVYSKKQEELAGTDGLESFREVFRSQSRLNVVLYRKNWAKTRWTRVEETAIKEKCLDTGWDSLLFVMFDNEEPPVWLPDTKIRLNYSQYPFEQLVGAIKTRSERQGSTLRSENSITRAKRLQQESTTRTERILLLEQKGASAAPQEYRRTIELITQKVAELQNEVPRLGIAFGCDGQACVLASEIVSLNFYFYPGPPVTKARIVLQEWNVALPVPPKRGVFVQRPEPLAKTEFYFDYQIACGGWCWHEDDGDAFLSTPELAEHILKLVMELRDKMERGEIAAPEDDFWNDKG